MLQFNKLFQLNLVCRKVDEVDRDPILPVDVVIVETTINMIDPVIEVAGVVVEAIVMIETEGTSPNLVAAVVELVHLNPLMLLERRPLLS